MFLFNLSDRQSIWGAIDVDQNLTENKILDILIGIYNFTFSLIGNIQITVNVLLWEKDVMNRIKKENILNEFKKATQVTNANIILNFRSADMKKNYMGNKLKVED